MSTLKRRFQIKKLILHLKELEEKKKEQTKRKANRRKEIKR